MSLMQRAHDVLRSADRHRPIARHESADAENDLTAISASPDRGQVNPQAVQRLQQTHGNRFVQRLLQRATSGTEGDCPGGCV
jgi:hypothetical protein